MAKKKREITETEINMLLLRVDQERLAFKRKLASLTDEQREELPLVLEECKQRSYYWSTVYSKRPKSNPSRRHFEEALLEEAVGLILNPPGPSGLEQIHRFGHDLLAKMAEGADLEEMKAWAAIHYPHVAKFWDRHFPEGKA